MEGKKHQGLQLATEGYEPKIDICLVYDEAKRLDERIIINDNI